MDLGTCSENWIMVHHLHPEQDEDENKRYHICKDYRHGSGPYPVIRPEQDPKGKEEEHGEREVACLPQFPCTVDLRDKRDGGEGPGNVPDKNDGIHELSLNYSSFNDMNRQEFLSRSRVSRSRPAGIPARTGRRQRATSTLPAYEEVHVPALQSLHRLPLCERDREEVRDKGAFPVSRDLYFMAGLIPFVDPRRLCEFPPPGNIGLLSFEPAKCCRHDGHSIRVDVLP